MLDSAAKSCDPEILIPSISSAKIFVRGFSFLAYRGFFLIFFGISCKKAKFRGSQIKKGGELPGNINHWLAWHKRAKFLRKWIVYYQKKLFWKGQTTWKRKSSPSLSEHLLSSEPQHIWMHRRQNIPTVMKESCMQDSDVSLAMEQDLDPVHPFRAFLATGLDVA